MYDSQVILTTAIVRKYTICCQSLSYVLLKHRWSTCSIELCPLVSWQFWCVRLGERWSSACTCHRWWCCGRHARPKAIHVFGHRTSVFVSYLVIWFFSLQQSLCRQLPQCSPVGADRSSSFVTLRHFCYGACGCMMKLHLVIEGSGTFLCFCYRSLGSLMLQHPCSGCLHVILVVGRGGETVLASARVCLEPWT